MKLIPYIASCDRGFTIVELMVSSLLGLLLVALALGSAISNRNMFRRDLVRVQLNENLRGALDIIGTDIRLGGESLGSSFPAIEVIDGGAGPDELIIRRNRLSEVLPVCTALTAGNNSSIFFAVPGNVAGCTYVGQTTSYNSWRSYRQDNNNTVTAFVWNSSAKEGEFFDYVSESDAGDSYAINTNNYWSHNYPTSSSAVYMLEEWHFLIDSDELRLIENRDTANPITLAFDVMDFQVQVHLQDGSVVTQLTPDDSWSNIESIEVTLRSSKHAVSSDVTRGLSGRFFPRNVLSN